MSADLSEKLMMKATNGTERFAEAAFRFFKGNMESIAIGADNTQELVEVYAEQIAVVAKRSAAAENVQSELENIISKAVADFGRSGVSQSQALRFLADRLHQMSATATPSAMKIFATAKEMTLHKVQDPGDLR